jgi:uncharacterized membrane protein YphA (DoxX/SURF4 family)
MVRAVLGAAMILEGRYYIGGSDPTMTAWILGFAAVAGGGLLLIGFLTPIIGLTVAAGIMGTAISLWPASAPNVFESKPAVVFAFTMLLTLIGLGPGAFSVDARLFGRREIIIPPRTSPSQR